MKSRAVEFLLCSAALAAVVGTAAISRRAMRGRTAAAATLWPAPSPNAPPTLDSLAVLTSHIVDGDAFRLDRKPAAVSYRSAGDTSVPIAPAAPPIPKPALALVGIVGGPPWAALVNGIPAHDATMLVRARDTLGGLRIATVSGDGVTITGLDTVWHLTTKRD
jgi:hypothetical protein